MNVVFRKSCSCANTLPNNKPKPSLHVQAPTLGNPLAIIDLDIKCPECGKPWIASVSVRMPSDEAKKKAHLLFGKK